MQQRLNGSKGLYLLSDPLKKKFANPWSKERGHGQSSLSSFTHMCNISSSLFTSQISTSQALWKFIILIHAFNKYVLSVSLCATNLLGASAHISEQKRRSSLPFWSFHFLTVGYTCLLLFNYNIQQTFGSLLYTSTLLGARGNDMIKKIHYQPSGIQSLHTNCSAKDKRITTVTEASIHCSWCSEKRKMLQRLLKRGL